MLKNKPLLLLIPVVVLGACTVTGPADDGFDNSNEWVDNGRLLSDDASGYTIYKSDEKQGHNPATNTATDSSSDNQLDYSAYRQWLDAKQSNSPEYQKFLQWQEFENFQRWKEQQKTE